MSHGGGDSTCRTAVVVVDFPLGISIEKHSTFFDSLRGFSCNGNPLRDFKEFYDK
jgi:hypothetical protein